MIRHGPCPAASVAAVTDRLGAAGALPVALTRIGVVTRVNSYVALTKPRIIELLLITTVPTMFVAAHRVPRSG